MDGGSSCHFWQLVSLHCTQSMSAFRAAPAPVLLSVAFSIVSNCVPVFNLECNVIPRCTHTFQDKRSGGSSPWRFATSKTVSLSPVTNRIQAESSVSSGAVPWTEGEMGVCRSVLDTGCVGVEWLPWVRGRPRPPRVLGVPPVPDLPAQPVQNHSSGSFAGSTDAQLEKYGRRRWRTS